MATEQCAWRYATQGLRGLGLKWSMSGIAGGRFRGGGRRPPKANCSLSTLASHHSRRPTSIHLGVTPFAATPCPRPRNDALHPGPRRSPQPLPVHPGVTPFAATPCPRLRTDAGVGASHGPGFLEPLSNHGLVRLWGAHLWGARGQYLVTSIGEGAHIGPASSLPHLAHT